MAEAFGVAGSAAGIFSLGIQLTQGLLKYYGSWKGQDGEILKLWASLDNLSEIFRVLSKIIEPSATSDKKIRDTVGKSIHHVDVCVGTLKEELKKIQDPKSPKPEWKSTMRRHVRRAYYPFKEETLEKIQRAVDKACGNLNLSLQALEMFVHHHIISIPALTNIQPKYFYKTLTKENQDQQIEHILNWLSPTNFWLQQEDLSSRRQPGAGQWLLNHPRFLSWAEGKEETVWCRGAPGVGKTVLVSSVVEFLESDLPTQGLGLAFLYCDHKSRLLQTVEYFLGAIIRQIVERRLAIPEDIKTQFQENRGKGPSASSKCLPGLLKSLANECSEVYIVIDALDECIDKNGNSIWNCLLKELKHSASNLHLLCTSREIDDVSGILAESSSIDVRADDVDIQSYIQKQIHDNNTLSQLCKKDPTLKDRILETVTPKADGMFLAARLHIESLASKTNPRAVRKALNTLPTTLDGSYDEAMERIQQQPTKHLGLQALLWIVYAVRPLQLQELQHAIAVDELESDDQSVSEDHLTLPSIIINGCAGMVKIDEKSNTVRLVHTTAQEYFDRNGATHFPNAHGSISTACLKYLMLEVFAEGHCSTDTQYERRLKENALLKYAAQYLGSHVQSTTGNSFNNLILEFLLDKRKLSCAVQALYTAKGLWSSPGYSQQFPKVFKEIHYVSYFGLKDIVCLIIDTGKVDVDSKDSYGRTPLSYAASNGHEAVV
ncbi:hypothetical protein AJ78_08434, partial [Emergomyces pasteurianus Ep9510]